jgi:hypothetical protein
MLHQTPDLNYFIHPLALRKLALFLVEYVNVPSTPSPPSPSCSLSGTDRCYKGRERRY